jgi:ubiquinone/menaquinone biosynthesis C-methylase UbiE
MEARQTHTDRIREQFTKQADAYSRMQQTRDEAGLSGLVMLCGTRPEDRVLDVACGPGFLTMAFAAHCGSAVGVDATGELLARARAEAGLRGLANVEFRGGDAYDLGWAARGFDIVACRAAFHHFVNPKAVVGGMKEALRAGGKLLIADMLGSEDRAKAELHDRIEQLCDPTHVRALPQSDLDALFAAAGLKTEACVTTRIDYDAEEWMDHGGPPLQTRREIVALLESSIDGDRAGLAVRHEDGRLRFSHVGAAFVLTPV